MAGETDKLKVTFLAIRFFRNTLAGDALYTIILFGGFALAQRHWPVLRAEAASVTVRA